MIKKIFVVVALLVFGFNYAQEGSLSPYSFFGTGDKRFKGMVENRAMGGITVFTDSIHLNYSNPASLGGLRLTTFGVSGSSNMLTLKTDAASESAKNVSFDYLILGMPVARNVGVSFGLLADSSVDYSLQSLNEDVEPIQLNQYTGNGNINKVFIAAGWNITPNLSVGATGNFNFGSIERTSFRLLDQIQYGTREVSTSDYSGWDFNFALNYKTKVFKSLQLQSTLQYVPKTKISSSNVREISTIFVSSSGSQAVVETEDVDLVTDGMHSTYVHKPEAYTVGLGVGKPLNWFVGGEYQYKKMSEYNIEFMNSVLGQYEDAEKFSAGGFWIPDYNSFTSYWKRVTYRLGIKNEKTGLLVNNVPLYDFGMTFGLGLPVEAFSNANIGFEIGKRGTTNFGRVQENYFSISISLSLNDRWFVKTLIK
ncbi:hypothetical protein [Robertkochia solimangrovi]|uniref:hypothetical protein n=1 Tax=Robertkochia solimangrovi TaxID=2213046 RepID=UPI00117CEB4A|nr:hypothetical protein [Robertkochia solimangrovi]TRZ43258.1 hypothetical protein DMZ48_11255 [Robertkochia solimangrovi]